MRSTRTRLLYLEAVGWSQRCYWDSLTFSRRSKSLQAPYQSVLDRGVVKCTGYMVTGGKNIRLMIFWSFTLGATGCRWQTAQTCGVATPQGSVRLLKRSSSFSVQDQITESTLILDHEICNRWERGGRPPRKEGRRMQMDRCQNDGLTLLSHEAPEAVTWRGQTSPSLSQ